ncbi:MAG TPA: DUF1206 domain-containing protein [Euzebyales bacterium]
MTASLSTSRSKRHRLAQAGLIARGVLYCLIGILAIQVAFGDASSQQASQSGALRTLAQQPGGTVLVTLVGLGLLAYAAWRGAQFFLEEGDEDGDSEVKDKVIRASYLVRAVVYVGLAFTAFSVAFGSGGGGGSSSQALTATIMKDVPGGVFLIGLVGLILIGVSIYHAYKAFTTDFMEDLRQHELSPTERIWYERMGIAGYTARAITYALIGIFVTRAAVTFDPSQAQGLDAALQELSQTTGGPWILTAVALGLFMFGAFSIVRARYLDE